MKTIKTKLWFKITALILFVLLAVILIASGTGIANLAYSNVYTDGGADARKEVVSGSAFIKAKDLLEDYCSSYYNGSDSDNAYFADLFTEENSNFYFSVTDENGNEILKNYYTSDYQYSLSSQYEVLVNVKNIEETKSFETYSELMYYIAACEDLYAGVDYNYWTEDTDQDGSGEYAAEINYVTGDKKELTLNCYVKEKLTASDDFSAGLFWVDFLINQRYTVIAVCSVSFIFLITLFVMLLCSAGHKEGSDVITLSWFDKIPLDLYTVFLFVSFVLTLSGGDSFFSNFEYYIYIAAAGIIWLLLGMSFLITFAARAKAGGWWKNTVTYMVLRMIWKIVKSFFRAILYAVRSFSLYWQFGLSWAGLSFTEFLAIVILCYDPGILLLAWFVEKMILTPFLILAVINMKILQKTGAEIAAGNLSYTADLNAMIWEFKKHGRNLNSISSGMALAVEEQMKSERLKTELITNVSHDIKTPLTSIINYVDLLKKSGTDSKNAAEYIGIIDRQSSRLKKMTEDLVEASKASSGNINVNLENTDVNLLLAQAAAEYSERFAGSNLDAVLSVSPFELFINADGKLLWRVFDNLMNNICKYTLEKTRVYISTESVGVNAVITFKNISKYPLNISSSELMDRFVRGDASRHTEGSGLGLSIAKSLTDLQNGNMEIFIDGDLFKVVITFCQADKPAHSVS